MLQIRSQFQSDTLGFALTDLDRTQEYTSALRADYNTRELQYGDMINLERDHPDTTFYWSLPREYLGMYHPRETMVPLGVFTNRDGTRTVSPKCFHRQ